MKKIASKITSTHTFFAIVALVFGLVGTIWRGGTIYAKEVARIDKLETVQDTLYVKVSGIEKEVPMMHDKIDKIICYIENPEDKTMCIFHAGE